MQIVGSFTNLLPVRIRLSGSLRMDVLLGQIHATIRRLMAYGRVPLALVLRESQSFLNMGPVFPVWCQLRVSSKARVVGPHKASFEPFSVGRAAIQCDLEADLSEADQGLECMFAHRAALFEKRAIAVLVADYGTLLRLIAAEPEQQISNLCNRLSTTS